MYANHILSFSRYANSRMSKGIPLPILPKYYQYLKATTTIGNVTTVIWQSLWFRMKYFLPSLFRCYSTGVGRLGGKQKISLGFGCITHGIAVHEIGHALGNLFQSGNVLLQTDLPYSSLPLSHYFNWFYTHPSIHSFIHFPIPLAISSSILLNLTSIASSSHPWISFPAGSLHFKCWLDLKPI